MNIETAITTRRSVKHYNPDHPMPQEEIDKLLSLATLSPTAFNIQHWRFVVVKDPELRQKIREVSFMQAQITEASLLIVLCADTKAWRKETHRYWRNTQKDVQESLVRAIHDYYDGREQVQRDEAMRSCGIAAQTLMLAAKGMGYDTCAMDLSDLDEVGKLINLPDDHLLAMMIAVGKPTQEARPRGGQLALDEVVITDRF